MAFDANRLKFGDLIAGGGAVVLFISLFLNWYKVELKGFGGANLGGASESASGWEALGPGDIFLVLIVIVVIAIVVMRALGAAPAGLPVPLSTVILGLGALAALYTLFRIFSIPHGDVPDAVEDAVDFSRSIGVFLAFLSTLAITAGGFLSARERGEAVPGVEGGVGGPAGGAGGGPLGTGQPAGGAYAGQPAAGQPVGGQPAGGAPAGGAPAAGAASAGAADPGAGAGGNPPPDWYDDPRGEARLRYWDGQQWTDQTAQ
jgi:hypothetical protein